MHNPNLKTEVKHSTSKSAWNIVGTELGKKYKIATVPYGIDESEKLTSKYRKEAFEHAEFISYCFNNASVLGFKQKINVL